MSNSCKRVRRKNVWRTRTVRWSHSILLCMTQEFKTVTFKRVFNSLSLFHPWVGSRVFNSLSLFHPCLSSRMCLAGAGMKPTPIGALHTCMYSRVEIPRDVSKWWWFQLRTDLRHIAITADGGFTAIGGFLSWWLHDSCRPDTCEQILKYLTMLGN